MILLIDVFVLYQFIIWIKKLIIFLFFFFFLILFFIINYILTGIG